MRRLSRLLLASFTASCVTGCGSCLDEPDRQPPPSTPSPAAKGLANPTLSTHRPRLMRFGQIIAGEDSGTIPTGDTE